MHQSVSGRPTSAKHFCDLGNLPAILTFLSCEAVAERSQRQCELGLSDIFTSQWKARTVLNF